MTEYWLIVSYISSIVLRIPSTQRNSPKIVHLLEQSLSQKQKHIYLYITGKEINTIIATSTTALKDNLITTYNFRNKIQE